MQSRPHGYGLFKWSDTDCMEVDRDFQEELGASEALSIVPGRRERKDGLGREREREREGGREERGIQLMMSLWRKLNQRPSLFLRCLVLQVTLIVGRSAGRYRLSRRWIPTVGFHWIPTVGMI